MPTSKINKLMEKFNERNIDSIFITSKSNIYYYSNYYTDPHERLVAVYISKHMSPLLIVPTMEVEDAKRAGWSEQIIHYGDHENVWEKFLKYVTDQKAIPETLGLEFNDVNVERYEMLKNIFPKVNIVDMQDDLAQLRLIKNEQEFQYLQEAARLADYGIEIGKNAIQEGATELEIVAELEYALKKKGVQEMSFSTTVLTGQKTASPHGIPGLDKVTKGDFVLFDLGVVHKGYCSDITRTFAFGEITEEQKLIYETVLEAEESAIKAAQLGTKVGLIDQTARKIITDAGYGQYFTHRIGHGLGIDIHEYPSMHKDNPLLLKEGMCFTIEPGIYIPEIGGVRIEDMIFMTKKGPLSLTKFPKQLQILK